MGSKPAVPPALRRVPGREPVESGIDLSVIARWLGYAGSTMTHHDVEADLAMKDCALARLQAPDTS